MEVTEDFLNDLQSKEINVSMKPMKDNTSVLFREGTITESLPITEVTTFT